MKTIGLGPVITLISLSLVVVVTMNVELSNAVAQETTSTPVAPLTGTVTAEALNVRSGPGADFEAVGVVHKDDILSISGCDEDASWVYMTHESLTGWVAAKHVSVAGDVATLTVLEAGAAVSPPTPTGAAESQAEEPAVVLEGRGRTATKEFTLPAPVSVAHFTHKGSRNFIMSCWSTTSGPTTAGGQSSPTVR
jgi:uncharacterized protein YraI